jgi:uncharacterized protein (TIGR02466 family)
MKFHYFCPSVICETKLLGYKDKLIDYYQYHSFDNTYLPVGSGRPDPKSSVHKDKRFLDFFIKVKEKVIDYLEFFNISPDCFEINFTKTWYAITNQNLDISPHIHAGSHISYIYYLQIEENDPLYFSLKNPNQWFLNSFDYIGEKTNLNHYDYEIQPSNESLIIFPSKFSHSTKNGRNNVRMCISGDIILTLNKNDLQSESGIVSTSHWLTLS